MFWFLLVGGLIGLAIGIWKHKTKKQAEIQENIIQDKDLLEDKDAWEEKGNLDYATGFIDKSLPMLLPCVLKAHIDYTDVNGKETKRNIMLRTFTQDSVNGWVEAFCELRRQNRTFKYQRISNFINCDTGEVIKNDEISQYLFDIYIKTPDAQIEKYLSEYMDILKILVSVARADGRMTVTERRVIVEYFLELSGLSSDFTDLVHEKIKSDIWEHNSIRSFNSALRSFVSVHPEKKEKLFDVIKLTVNADKKLTTEEEKYLEWAEKILILGKDT